MTLRRLVLAGFLLALVAILASSWYQGHQSCLRTNGTRAGLSIFFTEQAGRAHARSTLEHGRERHLDLKAHRAALQAVAAEQQLDCNAVVPGT